MKPFILTPRTRAQESRAAIERIYVIMRHLFIRGYYKPGGASGEALIQALLTLRPEIYGSMGDPVKVELDGLVYVMDRLPCGIEMCRFIQLIAAEGYDQSNFEAIIPAKRRRNCYRVDQETMLIEITRGRSEIYDILTHLTFLYIEANKIRDHALVEGSPTREWLKLQDIVTGSSPDPWFTEDTEVRERAFCYLSILLGRTFEETVRVYHRLKQGGGCNNGLFHIIYWLGKIAIEESQQKKDRQITFSSTLRERIGHHIHGEYWAGDVKQVLLEKNLWDRPLHIISANLHSVMNCLFAMAALQDHIGFKTTIEELARELSLPESQSLNQLVKEFAQNHGLYWIPDQAGTNIQVQIIDTTLLPIEKIPGELKVNSNYIQQEKPVLLVMDYAFGEQAFEIMDELLKPYKRKQTLKKLNVHSISVMGKAGILVGEKGDLMLPNAHIFEGTADNYPFVNEMKAEDFAGYGIPVYEGALVTVLGTSLQNADILSYFKESSWNVIGLEMEGAHLQKAIQAASCIRNSIDKKVILRYAYYASDNPLVTGTTLASGSLGLLGIKPTYLITLKFLSKILNPPAFAKI
jgi:hypothetical protein